MVMGRNEGSRNRKSLLPMSHPIPPNTAGAESNGTAVPETGWGETLREKSPKTTPNQRIATGKPLKLPRVPAKKLQLIIGKPINSKKKWVYY